MYRRSSPPIVRAIWRASFVFVGLLACGCLKASAEPASNNTDRQVNKDIYGSPMPLGAIARIGTRCFVHSDSIHALGFTSDSTRIASSASDGIRVWDTMSGREVISILYLPAESRLLSISPDNAQLATVDRDGAVHIYDMKTGDLVNKVASGLGPWVTFLAFSQDCKRLIIAGSNVVKQWNTDDDKVVEVFQGREALNAAYSPMADTVAISSRNLMTICDLRRSSQIIEWKLADESLETADMTFSADGKIVAIGRRPRRSAKFWKKIGEKYKLVSPDKNYVEFYDVATARQVFRLHVPSKGDAIHSVRMTSKGDAMCVHVGKTLQLFELDMSTQQSSLKYQLPIHASCVAMAPTGEKLAASDGTSFTVVEGPLWKPILHTGLMSVSDWAFSPSGTTIATCSVAGGVQIWNSESGEFISSICDFNEQCTTLDISPLGDVLVTGQPKAVKLWDIQSGKLLRSIGIDGKQVVDVKFAPNGKIIAVGAQSQVFLVDSATGTINATIDDVVEGQSVSSISWRRDSRSLVYIRHRGMMTEAILFNEANEANSIQKELLPFQITSAKFSPDGKTLLLCVPGLAKVNPEILRSPLRIIDAQSGQRVRSFDVPNASASIAEFHPTKEIVLCNGRIGAQWSDKWRTFFWNMENGQEILSLMGSRLTGDFRDISPRGDKLLFFDSTHESMVVAPFPVRPK